MRVGSLTVEVMKLCLKYLHSHKAAVAEVSVRTERRCTQQSRIANIVAKCVSTLHMYQLLSVFGLWQCRTARGSVLFELYWFTQDDVCFLLTQFWLQLT